MNVLVLYRSRVHYEIKLGLHSIRFSSDLSVFVRICISMKKYAHFRLHFCNSITALSRPRLPNPWPAKLFFVVCNRKSGSSSGATALQHFQTFCIRYAFYFQKRKLFNFIKNFLHKCQVLTVGTANCC